MNSQAAVESEIISSAAAQTRTAAQDPAVEWLCYWCLHRVANDQDRFSYGGRDEFVFRNPERVQFEFITFARTLGCRDAGEPTLEYTWFPEHAWCYCPCGQCGAGIGGGQRANAWQN
jgi:hypothetical protein